MSIFCSASLLLIHPRLQSAVTEVLFTGTDPRQVYLAAFFKSRRHCKVAFTDLKKHNKTGKNSRKTSTNVCIRTCGVCASVCTPLDTPIVCFLVVCVCVCVCVPVW